MIKLYHNLFCRDIEAQLHFYMALLDLPEAAHARSPIYRAIETPGFQFGFHAPAAYDLLLLGDRVPPAGHEGAVSCYPTFMLETPDAVSSRAQRVAELGGKLIKPPYATYYAEWQTVLADPEGHVFRLSCGTLPEGVQASALKLEPAAQP